MKRERLRVQVGYHRRLGHYGKPAVMTENRLAQNFDVEAPNRVWVTDITYIRTREGWLHLAVAQDLFSRQVIGWLMRSRIDSELAINALLMAPPLPSSRHCPFRPGVPVQQS